MALSLLGHHAEAAELVGAVSVVATIWHTFRRAPRVAEAWAQSRAALGDDVYDAAFARVQRGTTTSSSPGSVTCSNAWPLADAGPG